MAIAIRKGNDKDLPALMEMIKELGAFERQPKAVRNTVAQMRKQKKFFKSFIAAEDGKIVGSAIYFFAYSTWVGKSLYLEDLYVKPKYRNRKVGSMLLREIFKLAKKEDCGRVRWQVIHWNKDAIRLYERHGAKISRQWLNCDFDRQGIERFLRKSATD